MEKFTHRCIRAIDREGKWDGKEYPHTTRREMYMRNDQPTTASWINYLRLRHAIQDKGTIERTTKGEKNRKTEAIKTFQEKWANTRENIIEAYGSIIEIKHALSANTIKHALRAKGFIHQKKYKNCLDILNDYTKDPLSTNEIKNSINSKISQKSQDSLTTQKWPTKNEERRKMLEKLLELDENEAIKNGETREILDRAAILLEYPKKSKNEGIDEEQKCPTCSKKFLTLNALNKHRANDKKCKVRWILEKSTLKICNNEDCGEAFKTDKLREDHERYHCKNEHKQLRKLKNGTYNRSYQTNVGDPTGKEEYLHNGKIKFDGEKNKWICLECGYEAGTYNSKAVKIHWNMHTKRAREKENKEQKNGAHKHNSSDIERRFDQLKLDEEEIESMQKWHDWKTKKGDQPNKIMQQNSNPANNDSNEEVDISNDNKYPHTKLGLTEYKKDTQKWHCKTQNCNKEYTTYNAMATHIGKAHSNLTRKGKDCPYCPRRYALTRDMLLHLKIITADSNKTEWKTATCNEIPEQDDPKERWNKLNEKNKPNI